MRESWLTRTRASFSQLLSYPFRLFFLSTGLVGVVLIPAWLTVLWQGNPQALAVPGLFWHQHEMMVGFLNAAIAGFLLTAVCNWTGTQPVTGMPLFALWLVWLAGRVAMLAGAGAPALTATVDLAFLPLVALIVGARVLRARQFRQLPVLGGLAGLWVLDLLFHLQGEPRFLRALVVLAAVMILVIGGRITPAFSRNWLHRMGLGAHNVQTWPPLDWIALAAGAALVLAEALAWRGLPIVLLASLAAVAAGLRLLLWKGWLVRKEPLLWVLHLGHLWVVAGLALRALAEAGLVADTVWLHALGPGAMGTMVLGVMTRVALGHTGRELLLPPGVLSCYVLISLAALTRVLAGMEWIGWHVGLWASGVFWTLAFARFCILYWPILSQPREDGRPG